LLEISTDELALRDSLVIKNYAGTPIGAMGLVDGLVGIVSSGADVIIFTDDNVEIEGETSVAITAPAGQLTLNGAAFTHDITSKSLDTIYQNTSGKIRFVTVTIDGDGGVGTINAQVKATSAPDTIVACGGVNGYEYDSVSFIVPPGYYYRVAGSSDPVLDYWTEWDLF